MWQLFWDTVYIGVLGSVLGLECGRRLVRVCVHVSVSCGQHDCQLRAVRKSVSEEMRRLQRSVLDKVTSVQLRMATQRTELADLRRSLTQTDTRITRLTESFRALSDDRAQLDSEQVVERYVDAIIDTLVQHGRAMRLVACYVDTADARPTSQPPQAAHHTACPPRCVARGQTFSFHPATVKRSLTSRLYL